MTKIEELKAQIKVLQSKLSFLEELEKTKSPVEEAFKRVYGHYPVSDDTDGCWENFQAGYKSAQKDYKVGEWEPTEQNIGQPVIPSGANLPYPYTSSYIHNPKQSNWSCYMFGNRPGGSGIVYTPQEGRVPNRFVRFMMYLCFDCKWVKKDT